MNILVTGGRGQLALCIKQEAQENPGEHVFFFPDRADLDITRFEAVAQFAADHKIDAIINTAAYTAVDLAEEETEAALALNHLAVKHLGELCKKNKIRLIHLSTDYVFDGNGCKPYKTTDKTVPVNAYGNSKRAGERALETINIPNSCVIRTSWLYSEFNANFCKTMLKLASERSELQVVDDQIGTPTYARDLALFILKYALNLKTEGPKIFHYTNEGVASWYDFAVAIFQLSKSNIRVMPVSSTDFATKAQRPCYSVLDKTALKEYFGCAIPYWRTSLVACLTRLNQIPS